MYRVTFYKSKEGQHGYLPQSFEDKETAQSVVNQLSKYAVLEAYWVEPVSEVDDLKARIHTMEQEAITKQRTVEQLRAANDELRAELEAAGNDRLWLLNRIKKFTKTGQQWEPVEDQNKIACASGDGYTFDVWCNGYSLTVRNAGNEELTVELGDLRICRKVGGEE